ncbi:YicC/YloC family endoribonuclease [Alloalcanivorax sp. C16-2]|uniref:YicC/YloC family endoribonuclease n=1 Tax=Alloalcanivorax TaxID=3020832 RepID=UPI001931D4D2|nr:YicC/YloC family endoribonuclease [Alloalcanivorax marinus]MBL7252034.1 YicC family protein [Alloalcanivorax marinus]
MIRSMTAFARADRRLQGADLAWELRSVNHRYLELMPRLPDALRGLENALRERCRQRLGRGKVDITLRYQPDDTDAELELNEALVKRLSEAARRVGDLVLHAGQVNPLEVLQFPGVLSARQIDSDALEAAALELLDEALDALIATRDREGEQLAKLIQDRLDRVEQEVERVRKALPAIRDALRERLKQRVQEATDNPDPDRLEQELVLAAQKMDVDEELDRLVTHVAEVRRVVRKGGLIGRRLDFLMQELNREANTLASKSVDAETTAAAVELKVLIEQMREQIQNIE